MMRGLAHLVEGGGLLEAAAQQMSKEGWRKVGCHVLVVQRQAEQPRAEVHTVGRYGCSSTCLLSSQPML